MANGWPLGSSVDIEGGGTFSLPWGWPRWCWSPKKPGPGLPPGAQEEVPALLDVTLLGEGLETPGDPGDAGVEAAAGGEALVAGDAREAAVQPVLGAHA